MADSISPDNPPLTGDPLFIPPMPAEANPAEGLQLPQAPIEPATAAHDSSVIEYESPRGASKIWTVGTLAYTSSGLVVLFCWLLWGDFAWSMKERTVGPVVQLLIKTFGASDLLMSLFLISLPSAFGVIVGPIVSYRSDRKRGRWGRRIPYLLLTTPFATLAMFGLGASPGLGRALNGVLGGHSPGINKSTIIVIGLFWALFDIATVAANALFNALINDVVPSEFLGRFFGLFRALSLIAGMIFNYELLGLAKVHSFWIFVGVGLVYGAGFTLMCMKVKEGEYPPPPAIEQHQRPGFFGAGRTYIQECFTNPYYVWLIVGFTLANLTFIPVNLYSLPFAVSLNMNMNYYGKFIALTYLISFCISYPLGSIADRFHPLRAGIATLVLYAVVTLWGGIYSTSPNTFAVALVAHGVLSGVFFSCTASITQRLFPKSSYAQFYSAYWMIYSVSQVVLIPFVGKYLDFTGHAYRQAFLISCGLATLSAILMLEVHRRFMLLGGVRHYVAPE